MGRTSDKAPRCLQCSPVYVCPSVCASEVCEGARSWSHVLPEWDESQSMAMREQGLNHVICKSVLYLWSVLMWCLKFMSLFVQRGRVWKRGLEVISCLGEVKSMDERSRVRSCVNHVIITMSFIMWVPWAVLCVFWNVYNIYRSLPLSILIFPSFFFPPFNSGLRAKWSNLSGSHTSPGCISLVSLPCLNLYSMYKVK